MEMIKELTWADVLMYLPYKNQEEMLEEAALATMTVRPWCQESSKQYEQLNEARTSEEQIFTTSGT